MSSDLTGRRIAILATDGFEQSELTEPKRLLEQAGAQTDVIAPGDADEIEEFDALVLPGGVMNPDKLRLVPAVISLIKAFDDGGKPVAAICHGPWTLIEAGLVKSRQVTSWPSLRTDLENAGAHWQDSEVVRDGQLITSRRPGDIPAFADAIIDALGATV